MFLVLIGRIIFTEMFKTMMNSEFQVTEGVHMEARLLLGRSFVKRTQFELLGPRFSQWIVGLHIIAAALFDYLIL